MPFPVAIAAVAAAAKLAAAKVAAAGVGAKAAAVGVGTKMTAVQAAKKAALGTAKKLSSFAAGAFTGRNKSQGFGSTMERQFTADSTIPSIPHASYKNPRGMF